LTRHISTFCKTKSNPGPLQAKGYEAQSKMAVNDIIPYLNVEPEQLQSNIKTLFH